MRGRGALAGILLLLAAVLCGLILPGGAAGRGAAVAQETTAAPAIDHAAWARLAARAEAQIADPATTDLALEQLRGLIVEWRERFQAAQDANRSRIAAVEEQIAALGPPPAEGEAEPPALAERRRELEATLARLRAPGLEAQAAFQHADSLVREIDTLLRNRQADALMRLAPTPLNPANWPAGLAALTGTGRALAGELAAAWASETRRTYLREHLPTTVALLLLAAVLILRGRRWMEQLTEFLSREARGRGGPVWAFVVSLGQILVPMGGILALVAAVRSTGMVGLLGSALLEALPRAGFTILAALWLGGRLFRPAGAQILALPEERAGAARLIAGGLGLMLALNELRVGLVQSPAGTEAEAAAAVLAFPIILVTALLLLRLGQMLIAAGQAGQGQGLYRHRLLGLLGRGAVGVGLLAPVLAAVGYVAAASALVFPAVLSLGLLAFLIVLQRLVTDIYAALMRMEAEAAEGALVPVLAGFALALLALPLLALIWGARDTDLWELWARFRAGIAIGGIRISPGDVLIFVLVFSAGYMATRLVQGALGATVLPRTHLDPGGQRAVVAGVGYVGITIAAILAFTMAGIDLSSLAIVAGALSVGIGFGLQNIVSNFVSGIILLVERPISEGDWIQVGQTSGVVRSISVRSTRIETFDRNYVIVPNSELISAQVTNWTRFNLNGRLILPVSAAYGSDTRKVEAVLREIALAHPLVLSEPPPTVFFTGFGDSALTFEVRVILQDVNMLMPVRSELNHEIARRFAEEGIEMPFPQRDLWLRNPEALRAALDRPAPPSAAAPGAAPPPPGGAGA